MILQSLVGQTFSEEALFQTPLFEIGANYDQYSGKYIQFVLSEIPDKKFEITRVIFCKNRDELSSNNKIFFKKDFWIGICYLNCAVDLSFNRKDLTAKCATIFPNEITHVFSARHIDPSEPSAVLTEEEIILGIQELCGIMKNQKDSKSKKSV